MKLKYFFLCFLFICASCLATHYDETCCEIDRRGPLRPCGFGFELRAGVNPIIFADKEPSFLVVPTFVAEDGRVVKLYDGFKFSKIFKTPWIVAGQFNLNLSARSQGFIEFNYTQAKGDELTLDIDVRDTQGVNKLDFEKFSEFGAYIGHRYYFFSSCNCAANFYFGQKIGLGHYKNIELNIVRTEPIDPTFDVTAIAYKKQTVVSGGLQLGFDYWFSNSASFVIQVEVVASGPLDNSIDQFIFNPNQSFVGASNIIIGKTGTLVGFPVTAGFRFMW